MSADQQTDYSALVLHLVNDIRYESAIRASTDTGFVEEYDLCYRFENQTELRLRVCVIADVVNDRIFPVREYADSRAAKKLIEALT